MFSTRYGNVFKIMLFFHGLILYRTIRYRTTPYLRIWHLFKKLKYITIPVQVMVPYRHGDVLHYLYLSKYHTILFVFISHSYKV
jgi:hypothetical protein